MGSHGPGSPRDMDFAVCSCRPEGTSCGARCWRSPFTLIFPMDSRLWLPPWASWCAGRQVRAQTIRALPSPGLPQPSRPRSSPQQSARALSPCPQTHSVPAEGRPSLKSSEPPKSATRRGPEYGRWTAWAAPGRRRVAQVRPDGGWGACQRPWGRQRRLSWAAARLRSCFSCSSCNK